MKKTLVFLLFILLFSTSVSAANINDTDEKTGLLSALNIIGEEQYDDDDPVTRGEFAVNVLRFMDVDVVPNMYDASFEDVTEYTEFCDEIYYLKRANIISGAADGYFYPDMPISKRHAAIILARVLGYGDVGGNIEDYALKLNIVAMTDEELKHGELNTLLYNALNSKIVEKLVSPHNMYEAGGEYLYEVFGVCRGAGVVKNNSLTTLDGNSEPVRDKVVIGNRTLMVNNCDIDDFLGLAVNYYYIPANHRGNAEKKDILISLSAQSQNKIIEIVGRDIVSFDGRTLTYTVNDRVKTIRIEGDDDVIYNGIACPDYQDEYFWSKSGKITYIDNGSTSACIKLDKYINSIVSLATDEAIYFKDGSKIDFYDYEEGMLSFYDKDGNAIEEIAAGSVLSKYLSDDRKLMKVVCSTDILADVKIVAVGDDYIETDVAKLYINDKYTRWLTDIGAISGKIYRIHLDASGEVAKIERTTGGETIAYLLDIRDDIGGIAGTVYVKMLLDNGDIEIFECKDKISFNDRGRLNADQLKSEMSYIRDSESVVNQLVIYKLNNEGQITSITTASNHDEVFADNGSSQGTQLDLAKSETFKIVYRAGGQGDTYRTGSKSFGLKCPIDESTKIFFVLEDPLEYNSKYYWTGSISDIPADKYYSNIVGYTIGSKVGNAEAVIIEGVEREPAISANARLAAVQKVVKVINEDNETRTRVTLVVGGKIVAYNLSENVAKRYTLKVGDIIRYAIDRNYEISGIDKLYWTNDSGEKEFNSQLPGTGDDYYAISRENGRGRIAAGVAYDYDDGVLCLARGNFLELNEANTDAYFSDATNTFEYYKGLNSAFICVVEDNNITAGTVADIMPNSKIFITTRYDVVVDAFICK